MLEHSHFAKRNCCLEKELWLRKGTMAYTGFSYTRRDFGKIALASLPLARAYAAVNSKFDGVQIGAITYSFRSFTDAEEVIKAMVEIGLGEAELMSNHCEALAGAPAMPSFGRGGGG